MGTPRKIKSELKLYTSLEDLILYNFDRMTATQDYNWLIIGYTGKEKKIVSEDIKKVYDDIMDEYYNLTKDAGIISKMQKIAKIDDLVKNYTLMQNVLFAFSNGFELSEDGQELRYKYIALINGFFGRYGFKMPILNSPSGDMEECLKAYNQLDSIKAQIALLKTDLKDNGNSERISLHRQLQIATIALGYPHRLNPKEITVLEWIEIGKLVQEKAKLN